MLTRFKEDRINSLLKQFPVTAIVGPRQCGKTTIAKQVLKRIDGIYFDLESPADRLKFDEPEFLLNSIEYKLVVIDEVQRIPELFAILRSVVDKNKRKGNYLLLGSASPNLIKGVSESLAGRIAYCDIAPFNITEVYKTERDINKHWFRGGFPDAYLARSEDQCRLWLNNFFKTFIERDLNNLFGVNFSTELMFKIWRMLAHGNGYVWNAAAFAKGLDVSPTTVNRYLDFLEGAFMIRKLPPYFNNAKKRLVKSPKIYIRDSGILHYLQDIISSKKLLNNSAVGNAWEGYVLQLIPDSIQPYFYRTADGSEMDLLLVKGIAPIACIEIKTSNSPTISRGFHESLRDLKCKNAFIITPHQDDVYKRDKQTTVCGLIDFLRICLPELIKK